MAGRKRSNLLVIAARQEPPVCMKGRAGTIRREGELDGYTSELLLSLSVRTVVGVVLGGTAALAGWFCGWFFFLGPDTSLAGTLAILTVASGVGGGLGAAVGWLRPDDGVRANLPGPFLALAGGVGGAWGGLAFARAVFGVDVIAGEGNITAIAAAGIAANLPPLLMFAYRGVRGWFKSGRRA